MRRLILAFLTLVLGASGAYAADVPADWQHYSGRGFTASYPPGWTVNPAFVDKGYGFFQGDTDDVRAGVAFKPAGDIAPGTDLQSDQLKLVVQVARPGDLCTAAAFLVDPSPNYATERVLDKPDRVHTIAEAGDLYTLEQAVVIATQKPCIAVHYYMAFARLRPGDPRKAIDRQQLYNLLGAIASTVQPAP
ncbi:MAG: hypothetical protein JSR60_14645 [Proteobacteria bacterium]|nr:hypothetical protein [Pseudomonadota bacterium]